MVSVLDGRIEIVDEIKNADSTLQEYLIKSLREIITSQSFKGAIPGHFSQYGSIANDRIELLEQKLTSTQSK
ncbi:TPA: hypothetical protein P5R27_000077 [Legionella pneumophila]|nr:hypothetical protein [Legionella pneumophila]HDO8081871.1 hypothetical protein [Legionella pneumophila]HDO8145399.1 hypothetical protein [Legionella pneumophila]HDO8170194.1 hypothetical protein [Legionella pneumophila]HDO9798450.1 hypothetical protein [Legionella pneumophila]